MDLSSQADILARIETAPFTTGNFKTCSEEGGNQDITPPSSFETDSWNTIIDAVRKGNTDLYNVGDEKEVNLEGYGTHIVRIVNKSTPTECSNPNFSQTACGFVLEFKDVITSHMMNSTNTNAGGWEKSQMRQFINTDIYNSLPIELKWAIKDTKVVSGHSNLDESNFITFDKLYLLSPKEVYGINSIYVADALQTNQLDYYQYNGVNIENYSNAIKRIFNSQSTRAWWLRTPFNYDVSPDHNIGFSLVDSNGELIDSYPANYAISVSPAFKIN